MNDLNINLSETGRVEVPAGDNFTQLSTLLGAGWDGRAKTLEDVIFTNKSDTDIYFVSRSLDSEVLPDLSEANTIEAGESEAYARIDLTKCFVVNPLIYTGDLDESESESESEASATLVLEFRGTAARR